MESENITTTEDRPKFITTTILVILIAMNIFWVMRYFDIQAELSLVRASLKIQEINEKILGFGRLFIDKVLKAKGEINFDDRLLLENSVRGLGDKDVLERWEAFVDSRTEEEAQDKVRDLLEILLVQIKPK